MAAFANSFRGPFVYDDIGAIAENLSIRKIWPIWPALSPPTSGLAVTGRPLVNLSFAANYAAQGLNVSGYHAVNLAIHVLATLVLFGILRRTLERVYRDRPGEDYKADLAALAIALLWCVHPLQTESVTYLSQRAESLMGLFYLLTLYGFIRGWFLVSVVACLLGMASKEVMVSAPLVVLLYDRTFCAGTFKEAWRRHWPYYTFLGATWLLLLQLVASTGMRGGTAGFGSGVAWQTYLAAQFPAIADYLRLSLWPHPLIFGHGAELVHDMRIIAPTALLVVSLAAATFAAVWRSPRLGFLGVWFFAILAPSSSFVPVATETYAEHRMYLPLASVAVLFVLGVLKWLGRQGIVVFAIGAAALVWSTHRRNIDYQSNRALWAETATEQPNNPLAHFNLGVALALDGDSEAATAQYQAAVRLKPNYPEALLNLGNAFRVKGRTTDAISCFEAALRARPGYPEACNALGMALTNIGRVEDGIVWMRKAIEVRPDLSEAHHNLGLALAKEGKEDEAIAQFEEAARLQPEAAEPLVSLGLVLVYFGHPDQAVYAYKKALGKGPGSFIARSDLASAYTNLGVALTRLNRNAEAIEQFNQALLINPDDTLARNELRLALRAQL